jgi:hypothetical protein
MPATARPGHADAQDSREVLEVITPAETDRRRALLKRVVTKPPKSARALADGLRRSMDDAAKQAAHQTTGLRNRTFCRRKGRATQLILCCLTARASDLRDIGSLGSGSFTMLLS